VYDDSINDLHLVDVCLQSNALAVGDSLVVDNKTLSDVVKGASKLTMADATSRSAAGTATAAAAAAGISPASHVLTQDTALSAAAATSSCNAAVVAPAASHRFMFINSCD